MKRFRGEHRRGASLDVVDLGALLDHDERPLELAHVLAVDAEIRLKRNLDFLAGRDVHEAAATPDGCVEGSELVVGGWDDCAEVVPDDVRELSEAFVHAQEDDPLLLQIGAYGVVHDLGVVLGADPCEVLPFGLRDSEAFERVLDVRRDFVPRPLGPLTGSDVIVQRFEVEARKVGAPGGRGLAAVDLVCPQADLAHPLGLVLHRGDLVDDFFRQAPGRPEDVLALIVEAGFVFARSDVRTFSGAGRSRPGPGPHYRTSVAAPASARTPS